MTSPKRCLGLMFSCFFCLSESGLASCLCFQHCSRSCLAARPSVVRVEGLSQSSQVKSKLGDISPSVAFAFGSLKLDSANYAVTQLINIRSLIHFINADPKFRMRHLGHEFRHDDHATFSGRCLAVQLPP